MLKLTKKADYGLIALRHLALASAGPRGSASAKDIAEAYGIPLPLLSKVLQKLARAGLLASEQGTNGGYRLAREARDISALEVIRTIDGPIILTQCFTEHTGCDQSALCPVREPLRKVHEGILGMLSNITLTDLCNDDMPVPVVRPMLSNIQLPRLASS
ncbi:MAG TPA: Rrf2 family transcriptional regulator [Bryobacteraceae bacterium]|nr:Rrf2 family transcriptional regulator [Bryobacteraceae bacterium]